MPKNIAILSFILFTLIAVLGLHHGGVLDLGLQNSEVETPTHTKPPFEKKDYAFETLDNKTILLSQNKGAITLVNFWASWCVPCATEWPLILKLLKKHHGQIVLIAVSLDMKKKDMQTYLKPLEKKFVKSFAFVHHVWDRDSKIAQNFGTIKLPETIIVNQNTEIVKKIAGSEEWETQKAQKFITSLIQE